MLVVGPAATNRAGGGTAPYDDFTQVMPLFEGISDDGILDDVDATVSDRKSTRLNSSHT